MIGKAKALGGFWKKSIRLEFSLISQQAKNTLKIYIVISDFFFGPRLIDVVLMVLERPQKWKVSNQTKIYNQEHGHTKAQKI